jgi:hypothetical protein
MFWQVHPCFADMVHYLSSLISAAIVDAPRCTHLMFLLWIQILQQQTGYSEGQLMDCAMLLVGLHSEVKRENLPVFVKRYAANLKPTNLTRALEYLRFAALEYFFTNAGRFFLLTSECKLTNITECISCPSE